MKRLLILLLVLVGCRNVPLPPPPPGLTPKVTTARQRLAVTSPAAPIQGFAITNISVLNGSVTLNWQSGQLPFQLQGSPTVSPPTWVGLGNPIISREITFTTGDNHYWRVQGSVPLLSITNNTLTWKTPDVMPDTLTDFLVDRRDNPPPANQDPNDLTGWNVNQTGFPATVPVASGPPYKLIDSSAPSQAWYRVRETTANGIVVPYNVITSGAWAKGFGSPGSYDGGNAVIIDPISNNIIVAGYFQGTLNFGGLSNPLISAGGADAFLAKFSSAGVCQWSISMGGAASDIAIGLALDQQGNILLIGNAGISVRKFSPTGTPLWASQDLVGWANPTAVTSDSQGNVIVTGYQQFSSQTPRYFAGTAVYNTGRPIPFLCKFASDGTPLWWAIIDAHGAFNQSTGLAVGINDNIIISGYFQGNVDFGGGLRTNAGGFFAKFTSAGTYLWDVIYGNIVPNTFSSPARTWAFRQDSNGDLLVSGDFVGSVDFGGGGITGTSLSNDMFVAKYSGVNGAYIWAQPILGLVNSSGEPTSISIDAQNNVIVVGYYAVQYNFSGVVITTDLWNLNYMFAAKYNSAGILIWARGNGGTGNSGISDQANGVAVDSTGQPIIIGQFGGSDVVINGITLHPIGNTDIFLAKLSP